MSEAAAIAPPSPEKAAGEQLRVLSISCAYPNARDAGLGVFVRARLSRMAEHCDVVVVSPVPFLDYARLFSRRTGTSIPARVEDGPLTVLYPRWIYPPGGGFLNALLLAGQLMRPVARLRKQFDFDVIDAHFGYPAGIAAALLARFADRPFTITLRGNETMHAESSAPVGALMRWALRNAALVITVSDRLTRFAMEQGVPSSRVKKIPNGVNRAVFYPRPRSECRRALGIAESARVILSAGALIERKGHHRVVQALAGLRARGIAARLIVAGGPGREGNYEREIHEAVARHDLESQVTFTGQLAPEALAEYMSAADVLCLATSREGWPNVVHEALSCGTPVVVTDVGAAADLVPSDQFGFVAPAASGVALCDALARALTTQWDRTLISQWGRSRGWRDVAKEVADVLQTVRRQSPQFHSGREDSQ